MATATLDGLDIRFRFLSRGSTFISRGNRFYVRRKPGPTKPRTTRQLKNITRLKQMHRYFDTLTRDQQLSYDFFAFGAGATGRMFDRFDMGARIGAAMILHPLIIAGAPLPILAPLPRVFFGFTITSVILLDKDTIRIAFNPDPAGVDWRISLHQTLPRTGRRKPKQRASRSCGFSALNPVSPVDFTTRYQHLTGWHARYFVNTRRTDGLFDVFPDIFDL